jgi:aspartate kinase
MIVAKFGGSSVKDAEAMRACVNVVKSTPDLGVVIISATYNSTNELEKIYLSLSEGDKNAAESQWQEIEKRHHNMAKELGDFCVAPIQALMDSFNFKLKELFTLKSFDAHHRDLILSFGENMSSLLFQLTLKEEFKGEREVYLVPATSFLKTNSNFGLAAPKPESIKLYCEGLFREGLNNGHLFVTQGFIGSDGQDQVTTLGREGSDYSATLVASALNASEVHIWTDVDGVYSADPNIIKDAKKLEELTYDEATAFASAGAKVLFSKTLAPLISADIPLRVGKTKDPTASGTWIRSNVSRPKDLIGVTAKERSDGLILTLVGNGVYDLDIEHSEIDRGDIFRSFYHQGGDCEDILKLWYERYFS